jgi:conserved repeat domain
MKRHIIVLSVLSIFIYITLHSITIYAWGDNGGGRLDYTIDEINNGAIGATEISDGENYKESENYPGIIVFNSISDSVIGHEKNFVGARECFQRADGTWIGATKDTIWNANEIEVTDGQTYIIRAFVHNNNPNGEDAVAENTKVAFSVPSQSATETKVTGYISSSNATPSEYWDSVVFKSDQAFHLEYIYGSAFLENNAIGKGGLQLSDDVVTNASNGGTLIGYDKLDGRIPGCYQYDGYVTIKVKAVFDYDFMVETKVRLLGDKEWQNVIAADVGDKIQIQTQYKNTSDLQQNGVTMRDILPTNLRYIPGSIKLMDAAYPNGATINGDSLVGEDGLLLGDYTSGSNAFVMFTAEVVDDNLVAGSNTIVTWGQSGVGSTIIQDYASIVVYNDIVFRTISTGLLISIAICVIIIIILFRRTQHLKHLSSHSNNKD